MTGSVTESDFFIFLMLISVTAGTVNITMRSVRIKMEHICDGKAGEES